MSNNEFKAGDKVIIDPMYATKAMEGRVFEVARRLKVNYSDSAKTCVAQERDYEVGDHPLIRHVEDIVCPNGCAPGPDLCGCWSPTPQKNQEEIVSSTADFIVNGVIGSSPDDARAALAKA